MEGGIAIAREAESMLDYISDRREFWRQQKPDYKIGEGRMKGEASVQTDSALEMQVLGEDRLEKRSAVLEVQRI